MSRTSKILSGKAKVARLQRGMAVAAAQGDREQYDHLARHEQAARATVNKAIRRNP